MNSQLPDRIYLTGFMGSGKSTIAPLVAEVLAYDVFDLDEAIVSRADRSIPEIFDREGEAAFRRLEREILEETTDRNKTVISLGGGAITFTSNLQFVQDHGFLVYLRVSVDILVDRLYGAADRPLLRGENENLLTREELREKISQMLADRRPYYERAHLIVDAGTPTPEETTDRIVKTLR